MVDHGAPALLLLRFFLPAALLFASCFVFTLPSFVYLVAFLFQHYRPRYEVTHDNYPTAYLLFLFAYSTILIIIHIVLGALVTRQPFFVSDVALAKTLAIPDYQQFPWQSTKLLLSPVVVLCVTIAALNAKNPLDGQRFFKLRRGKGSDAADDTSDTSQSSRSIRHVHTKSFNTFESEPTPALLRNEPLRKFTVHMAGRGGIFWTTIACGFTGLSYSSIFTLVYLAAFSLVVVAWAFHSTRLHPRKLVYPYVVRVKWFRRFMLSYLLFIGVLQNASFIQFYEDNTSNYDVVQNIFRLIGFVRLDTSEKEGWAHVTGFCFAIATYVLSGIFVNALSEVLVARQDNQSALILGEDRLNTALNYYDIQFLHTVLHLSSIGLLTWSLVFPGLLTLPMLLASLAYFTSKTVRNSRVFDRIIVYAIVLQIAHFLFVAISASFSSVDQGPTSDIIRWLGLRKFVPQFTMNLVQALALGLFCTNIFCKRYIAEAMSRTGRENPGAGELNISEFVHNAAYSAVALKQRAVYSMIRLILDGLALTSLYLAAGAQASWLNSVFLCWFVVLCLLQAFGGTKKHKVMRISWYMMLFYSTIFLLITCTACRAIKEKFPLQCNSLRYGILPASNAQVVSYAATIVLSAIQVHFTWVDPDTSSGASLDEYRSLFWSLVRKYYLFCTYVALLLYPLVHPANFLSYGYVLFLAISIVVELVGPYFRDTRSVRPLIKAYWPTVVLFSVCALVSRYVIRFDMFEETEQLRWARKWTFGFDRIDSIDEFHFTVGDASMLLLVSLQGRFFGIESIIDEAQKERQTKNIHSSEHSQGITVPAQAVPTEADPSGSTSYAIGSVSQAAVRRRTNAPQASTPGYPPLSRRVSFLQSQAHCQEEGSNRRFTTGTDGEKFQQFQERIMKWRMSLPVKQTEKFFEACYNYGLVLVRNSLLHYSFVLEACAILAAAVWLPGFSVFGAIYIILGCILLLSEQASYEKKGYLWSHHTHRLSQLSQESRASSSTGVIMRMLPLFLSILSFTLMSLQYIYMVAAKIRDDELKDHVHIFEYFGLRSSVKGLPIDEPAMLAHVLVFLTAFLQRIAVKWAQNDARKKMEEERDARGLSGYLLDPLQSQRALDSAVNINEVLFSGTQQTPSADEPAALRATDEQAASSSSDSTTEGNNDQAQGVANSTLMPSEESSQPSRNAGKEVKMNPEVDFMSTESETPPESSSDEEEEPKADASSRLKKKLNFAFGKIRGFLSDCYALVNPFWIMWGFDLTFMYLVIGGSVTRTSFAVVYVALVMLASGYQRCKIASYWHLITLLLTCLVLLQYFMTLGLPNNNAYKRSPESNWREWLYIDYRNDTVDRKYDVTFAFLSVICASMTLNAVAPGPRGFNFWCRKAIPDARTWPPSANFERKDEEPLNLVTKGIAQSKMEEGRSSMSDPLESPEKENVDNDLVPHQLWEEERYSYDFTTRPMNVRNLIKLYSMRYSGSLVQLYMFATAVAVTSVFSGLLLLISFYFLFNFTQVKTKSRYFFIVRFYVLSVVFILVVYQAPFTAIERPWAEVLGLIKTETGRNGRLLLSLMVSLWVLCQVQGRIYESKGFEYVMQYSKEDEKLRFKRAVHDHNTRKYERMQGRNKTRRARSARDGRLKRLMKLKNGDKRSVDQLYQVCVVDEMNWLRSKVERGKGKAYVFSSHVRQKKVEEEEKQESWARRLLRFLFRGPGWRKYNKHPIISEARLFISRYSAWAVYSTMLLATVVHPTELTAVYPLCLFLYLIVEQPRPPKKVWQFLMIYVCIIITGKYIAKYVIPENIKCNVDFGAPRSAEEQICRIASGVLFDILIFLALLWHRTVLYNRGLWDLDSTEEEMILANEIRGEKLQTDPEMMMTSLPTVPETLLPHSPSPFRLFSGKDSDISSSHPEPVSAIQQCSDVGEVFRRAINKIHEMSGKTESVKGSDESQMPMDDSSAKRERFFVFQPAVHSLPGTSTSGPDDSASTLPGIRGFTRQFSLRASRTADPRATSDPELDPAQSKVQQSLVESRVIPDRVNGISEKLSVFHSTSKSGFIPGVMEHFRKLTTKQEHKAVGDYYILIFLVDFISFVFVTFGFSSIFGDDSGRQLPWWRANFIEITHLLTLIAMFFALVVDRVVYLTRSMKGKLVLQYVSVVVYHVVIFFLPGRNMNIWKNAFAKMFYMLRCVYFLLSGLQIRNGFPRYTTAQFLLRHFSTPGIIVFEIYNFIPFLWLMRTLLDWAVVPTSLEIFQYIRFVDIYIWLYRNRAVNTSRGQFRRKLGQQRRWLPRVYQGFGIFLLCALALFVPFLFFSVLNPFVSGREPNLATLRVNLLVPVSSQTQSSYNIFARTAFIPDPMTRSDTRKLAEELDLEDSTIKTSAREENFLADFGTISDEQWDIPDASKTTLADSVSNFTSAESIPSLFYEVTAKTTSEEFKLQETIKLQPDEGQAIADSLRNQTSIGLKLNQRVPLYGVLESGESNFKAEDSKNRTLCLRHVYALNTTKDAPNDSVWTLQSCANDNCECPATLLDLNTGRNRFVLKFAVVSHLQVGGTTILTMYVAILFTLANFMRGFFSDKRLIIPYIDMPYTLHLFQLVLDIIYARQDNQLDMEEILYNGLVDIYRDSHVLAKWTGERALKLPTEWWEDSEYEGLGEVAYQCYPSFAATQNEPYMTRIVD